LAIATVVVLAAACTSGGPGTPIPSSTGARTRELGGTLRTAIVVRLPQTLDPQLYNGAPQGLLQFELFRCCLLRTLMSYNGRPTNQGGSEIRPDLAAGPPKISSDGLRWTFRLKRGIHYGPPLQKLEVTTPDMVRALERESRLKGAPYAFYYAVIQGFDDFQAGRAQNISGLQTPDPYTLVIHLTVPTGDLGYRLSLPAAAPIPPDPSHPHAPWGVAQGHADDGRFLVSIGPYMFKGSENLDFSKPPARQAPVAGYLPPRQTKTKFFQGRIWLVRNPSWDRSTDPLRAAYADRIDVSLGGYDITTYPLTTKDVLSHYPAEMRVMFNQVARGKLDLVLDTSPSLQEIARFENDPRLAGHLSVGNDFSLIDYIQLNLAVPPFDDVHVRRAVNLAIDRATIQNRWVSQTSGQFIIEASGGARVTTHLAPDATEDNLLLNYHPSWMPSASGFDLAAAKTQIRMSKYDSNHDGFCDAPVCKHVSMFETNAWPTSFDPVVIGDLRRIGIEVQSHRLGDLSAAVSPAGRSAMFAINWLIDYPNASSFLPQLFWSRNLAPPNSGFWQDFPMLGATHRQLRGWGYSVTSVPSVDSRIDDCEARTGSDQVDCWASLDRNLMQDIVPWIPVMSQTANVFTSPRIARFSWDQSENFPALDGIALTPAAIAADKS
jgi:peptide/nickel transport system substrate-binding protein